MFCEVTVRLHVVPDIVSEGRGAVCREDILAKIDVANEIERVRKVEIAAERSDH